MQHLAPPMTRSSSFAADADVVGGVAADVSNDDRSAAYDVVAAAIRYLKAHAHEQPSLDDVAAHVGRSPSHLQRVFSAWAGISPKRFLQVLTVEHARAALASSQDVLSASLASGLSGPSRLHDLTVACTAMTPGELKARGKGLVIKSGRAKSPFGTVVVGVTDRGVCHLEFADDDRGLRAEFANAEFVVDDAAADDVVARALAGVRSPLLVRGTNFQVRVWQALLELPVGVVVSYGALADRIGAPRASRAVGSACGANTIGLLIPCHRVIREDGVIGAYRWGSERKSALLAWEATRR